MARIALVLLLTSLLMTTAAHAQVEPPTHSGLVIQATGDPVGVGLLLQVTVDEDLDPVVYGFDIYRSVLGDCEAVRVRITPEPLLRGAIGHHEFYLDDPAAKLQNVVYSYWVQVVDASRTDLGFGWFDYTERLAYASWGSAPVVGIGLLSDEGFWAPVLDPCEGSCYGQLFVEGADLAQWVDSGVVVELIGSIFCGFEGCIASVSSVLPAACPTVSSAPGSWGTLKVQYR